MRAVKPRHYLFAWFLLLRGPTPADVPEIDAALAWVWREAWRIAFWWTVVMALYALPGLWGRTFHDFALLLLDLLIEIWIYLVIALSGWFRGHVAKRLILLFLILILGLIVTQTLQPGWWKVLDVKGSMLGIVLPFLFLLFFYPRLMHALRAREDAAVARALQAEAAGERLARQTTETELRLLQAQVEPHFLYNTLANLRYLVQKDQAAALRMTDALIEYLRTSVPDIRSLRVPLGREIDHAGHYLVIMQIRMGDRLAFSIDVPEALRAIEVPPILVLTLVENAIKHGIAPGVEGGTVAVRAAAAGDDVEIEVTDTGVGLDARRTSESAAASTGIGLANLRSRLAIAYGRPIEVTLEPNLPRGARARIRLPRTMPRTDAETIARATAVPAPVAGATAVPMTERPA